MATAELRRIESYQYPNAHLGHLNDAQQAALDAFKELCEKEGYYFPKGKDGSGEASHDDETLLRYLRARKFVPKDALGQFKDTEDWRAENHLEELYEKVDINEYEATRRLYPQWTGRRDKRGIPVYVFQVSHLTSKTIAAYEESTAKYPPPVKYNSSKISPRLVRLFALYENLIRFTLPLCSVINDRHHPETPISQSNNIVDISGVGLRQFWNLKGHMQDASTLATAHYPETLDRIFIIGAPVFFPTVWGWIKRWFDPITVSKIFILSSSNMTSTLEKYIDRANIPKKYGGDLDFEFGMMPVLEPAIQNSIKWENPAVQNGENTFPMGPIRFVEENGEVTALAVGTENGKPRNTRVARLAKGLSIRASQRGGKAVENTPVDDPELSYLGTGLSTQPPDDGEEPEDIPPPFSSGTNTPATAPTTNPTSIASTPKQEPKDKQPPVIPPDARTGTHASDTHAEGTPAVNHHGDGDGSVTMEPATGGQAPKDVSQPPLTADRSEDLKQTGALVQAQQLAAGVVAKGQEVGSVAVEKVSGLVGGGEQPKEEEKQEKAAEGEAKEKKNVTVTMSGDAGIEA